MSRIDELQSMRTEYVTHAKHELCVACICRDATHADALIDKIEKHSDRLISVVVVPQEYERTTHQNVILIHCNLFKTSIMRSLVVYALKGLDVKYVWFVDDDDDFEIGDVWGLQVAPWYTVIANSAALWGYIFRKDLLIEAYESLREPELLIQEDSILVQYFRGKYGESVDGLKCFRYKYDQDASHYIPCCTLTEYLTWCKKMLLNVDYIMDHGDIWGLVAALWQKAKGVTCQRDRLTDLIYLGLQVGNMSPANFDKIKFYVEGYMGGIYDCL